VQIGGGASWIDVQCNIKCEAFKKASCVIGRPLPTVPLTPREIVATVGSTTCTVPFQVFTQAISTQCGFSAVPTSAEVQQIDEAKQFLIRQGYFAANEFNGVPIYWCALTNAGGVVPDRDLVYLNTSAKGSGVKRLASLLAHEMTHVRQYRINGTDKFKCDYVRQYSECSLANVGRGVDCQDRNHNSMEHEAYAMEDTVGAASESVRAFGSQVLSSVSDSAGRAATKFSNPLIHNRTIDACIRSVAFPEQAGSQCSQLAQRAIANAFCRQSGKASAVNWDSTFTGTFQHSYVYRNDSPGTAAGEWVPDERGGAIFTAITCL